MFIIYFIYLIFHKLEKLENIIKTETKNKLPKVTFLFLTFDIYIIFV